MIGHPLTIRTANDSLIASGREVAKLEKKQCQHGQIITVHHEYHAAR